MVTIDTAALRADAEAMRLAGGLRLDLTIDTVRALCDGYDEAQRLRGQADVGDLTPAAFLDAQQRFAALVADLRALCDAHAAAQAKSVARGQHAVIRTATVRAVIDRHAPATPTTEEDR